ncbi:MAG: transglutaminase family protein [Actinomycetes bacterium]
MQPLAELGSLMATADPPLDRSLAVLAAVVTPTVGVDHLLAELDVLADSCAATTAEDLCRELFGPGGAFAPARDDYYSPANSLLDRVLGRRTGIPISLAAVAVEVGRRRGVGLVGVGMPGHFLLRAADDPEQFFDTFDGGRRLDPPGCRRCFAAVNGPEAALLPVHLAPVGSRTIVGRVLNNLQVAAGRSGDLQVGAAVQRIRVLLSGATLN